VARALCHRLCLRRHRLPVPDGDVVIKLCAGDDDLTPFESAALTRATHGFRHRDGRLQGPSRVSQLAHGRCARPCRRRRRHRGPFRHARGHEADTQAGELEKRLRVPRKQLSHIFVRAQRCLELAALDRRLGEEEEGLAAVHVEGRGA